MKHLLLFLALLASLFGAYTPPILPATEAIYSDGATANRAQIQLGSTRTNLAGAPVASWVGWVEVPTSNPALETSIAMLTPSAAPSLSTGFTSLEIDLSTTGSLYLVQAGSVTRGNNRVFSWASFRSIYSGQRVWLDVRFTKGSNAPVVRVNGTDVSASFTASTAGTPPEWLDVGLFATYFLTGYNWPTGIAPLGCWLNAHLSNSESDTWRLTGRPPAWVADGGSMVNQIVDASRNSTFSAGAHDWGNTSATLSLSGGGLRIQTSADTGRATLEGSFLLDIIRAGRAYELSFDVSSFAVTGAPTVVAMMGVTNQLVCTVTGTGSYRGVFISNTTSPGATNIQIRMNGAGATMDIIIDNVVIRRIGALSLLAVQPILVIDDVTGIGDNQARLLGMMPITPRRDWRIVYSTATSGNEQIHGGPVFDVPERLRIASWLVNNRGASTRTASLGVSSGNNAYAASVSCPAGRTEITPATRFPGVGFTNLWVNSDGTDRLLHTITGQVVGNN